jgi:hypothetical protein
MACNSSKLRRSGVSLQSTAPKVNQVLIIGASPNDQRFSLAVDGRSCSVQELFENSPQFLQISQQMQETAEVVARLA